MAGGLTYTEDIPMKKLIAVIILFFITGCAQTSRSIAMPQIIESQGLSFSVDDKDFPAIKSHFQPGRFDRYLKYHLQKKLLQISDLQSPQKKYKVTITDIFIKKTTVSDIKQKVNVAISFIPIMALIGDSSRYFYNVDYEITNEAGEKVLEHTITTNIETVSRGWFLLRYGFAHRAEDLAMRQGAKKIATLIAISLLDRSAAAKPVPKIL